LKAATFWLKESAIPLSTSVDDKNKSLLLKVQLQNSLHYISGEGLADKAGNGAAL
jgi:hypothetical protein